MEQAQDFLDESKALHALVAPLDDAAFGQATAFKGWTINDVLRHLHYWNWMAWLQLNDEALLVAQMKEIARAGGMQPVETAHVNDASGQALVALWMVQAERTADVFAMADPKARLKWAGPDMSARSSITARLMETWAHGQEVYDQLGVVRENADRIRNIVVLGINTYGWTFRNRKLDVPEPMPFVSLTAPSGEVWTYGEPSEAERIEGRADEFAQVVTQTRNIADTQLKVTGPVAMQWMGFAQCFAGAPEDPPAPGVRHTMTPQQ
ncbi:TIGR03084 family metal-binding protein [Hyphomonas chukchiensis]|uniref:TIGR03084 family metal-binding protein n=1 Tax=Hyphomonas chukchiensis TaxID=1280947 RepID=UPI0030FAF984